MRAQDVLSYHLIEVPCPVSSIFQGLPGAGDHNAVSLGNREQSDQRYSQNVNLRSKMDAPRRYAVCDIHYVDPFYIVRYFIVLV